MPTIAEWMESQGVGQYAALFAQHEIGLDVLPELTDPDLEKLGLPLGARKRLLKAIRNHGPPTAADDLSPTSSSLAMPVATEGERRQLTVLFCDMVGFTELANRVDPEVLQDIIRIYEDSCAVCITRYEGYVFQRLGDGIVAFFGYPLAHEGEAERAIHAGLSIVDALSKLEVPEVGHIQVRIGIATGVVVVSGAQTGAVGETMNLASRLQGMAPVGSIVVSERVRRLASGVFEYDDLGEHLLKGIAKPTRAYRIAALSQAASRFEAATQEGLTPMVGRELEIAMLLERWSQAQDGEGQVVVLSGEAGIGKSRILSALRERLESGGASTLRFQCSPYHVNSAFYPSIHNFERTLKFTRNETVDSKLDKLEALVVTRYARPLEDVHFIASLLSLPTESRYGAIAMTPQRFKDETLRSLVDLTEAAARKQPTVMLYEDAHWADPTSLEVLDVLIDRLRTIPLLLVITHRPEFQPKWTGYAHVVALNLSKLTRAQSAALIAKLTQGKALPADLLERILAKTDGVPLFVEELTKFILESGDLKDVGDRYEYTGDANSITIPASLRDSLMARLDRHAAAKEIAQIGAAIGREFSYDLVSAVAPMTQDALDRALVQLTDSGLAFRRGTPPEAHYTFKHALVQDAAYDSLLKSRRQELHGKIARVIEERFPNVKTTGPEVLAHHYSEMGLSDKAIPYWIQAGQRRLGRLALREAIWHLNRALTLLETLDPTPQHDAWEIDTRIGLGSAHLALSGWGAPQIETMARAALALSERVQRADQWLAACYLLVVHLITALRFDDARELATKALEDGQRRGLDSHVLVGHGCLQWINGQLGNFEIARRHAVAFDTVYAPERHNQVATLNDMKAWIDGWSAHHLWMMGWPDQAEQTLHDGIEYARAIGNPLNLIFCLAHGGGMYFYRREASALLDHLDEASQLAKENALGFLDEMLIGTWRGSALMLSGRFGEGHDLMTAATALSLASNLPIMIPCHRLMTAEALTGLGRVDEAIAMLDGELASIANTGERIHEAEILRLRGVLNLRNDPLHSDLAEDFLQRALDVSRAQKAKGWELRAATNLARLWQSQRKRKEAYELLAPIYNWFTEGFDTKDLKEAKALLEELTG